MVFLGYLFDEAGKHDTISYDVPWDFCGKVVDIP